jgi:membrane fusion protein (multidrug efflux system)
MPDHNRNGNSVQVADRETDTQYETDAQHEVASKEESKNPPDPAKRRRGIMIGLSIGAILVTVCVLWWLHSRNYESTDDAEVDGHLNPVAARVSGTVTAVYVEDNQHVRAGQPLVDLDPKDAEVSLEQAQADYDQAVAQLRSEVPNLPIQQASNRSDTTSAALEIVNDEAALQGAQHDYDADAAKLEQARATNMKAQEDLVSYKQLFDKQELARSEYDQYVSTAKSDAAAVDAAAATVASQKKLIDQRSAQLQEQDAKTTQTLENAPRQILIKRANNGMREASVESYKAKLDQAKLNLAYCHVVAPVDGIVLQRSAELGDTVSSGQQLLMISQIDDPWVVANFKETQVRKMHPGQSVDIRVDALSKSLSGTVEAMAAATGDRASVLPSENATGNYVKVIQRLPVRIRFKSGQAGLDKLRPGMSVEPRVHLK